MSSGSSEAQLRSTGGLLLGSSESARCSCRDRGPAVCSGPVVHEREAVQGHGEHYDANQR